MEMRWLCTTPVQRLKLVQTARETVGARMRTLNRHPRRLRRCLMGCWRIYRMGKYNGLRRMREIPRSLCNTHLCQSRGPHPLPLRVTVTRKSQTKGNILSIWLCERPWVDSCPRGPTRLRGGLQGRVRPLCYHPALIREGQVLYRGLRRRRHGTARPLHRATRLASLAVKFRDH